MWPVLHVFLRPLVLLLSRQVVLQPRRDGSHTWVLSVRCVFVLWCAARPNWLAVQLERGGGGAGTSLEEQQRQNEPRSHLHFVSHIHTPGFALPS